MQGVFHHEPQPLWDETDTSGITHKSARCREREEKTIPSFTSHRHATPTLEMLYTRAFVMNTNEAPLINGKVRERSKQRRRE